MRPVHTLLHGAIDYAGLFPPAALDLGAAVANYASYRSGTACWALGRLIVPAARLRELEAAAAPCFPTGVHPWRISALAGGKLDLRLDVAASGDVADVAVERDTVGDPTLARCVQVRIRGWHLPSVGHRFVVSFPVVLITR